VTRQALFSETSPGVIRSSTCINALDYGFVKPDVRRSQLLLTCVLAGCTVTSTSDQVPTFETYVIRDLQTIHQAEEAYLSQFGRYGELAELGPGTSGARTPNMHAADLIPTTLASGEIHAYRITLTRTASGYLIHANPTDHKTGRHTFYSDQTNTIHRDESF